ncbi:hypothetical protein HYV74_03695 [Candidatus Uhrbacteria bacterium]|nr:hypothetical protein [Candidatus Uhrbacteria bacterium]
MKKLLLVGAGILVLGAGLGAGCAASNPAPSTSDDAPQPAASAPNVTGKLTLLVRDQQPGKTALIDMVNTDRAGFVVVHEDMEGKAGSIAGASARLMAGEARRVPVPMTVHSGLSHWVMFHVDDGDGAFNAEKDMPMRDADGDVMMKSFRGMGAAMQREGGMM